MSRLAKKPILIPQGTEVVIEKDKVTVKGPRGQLVQQFPIGIILKQEDNHLWVSLNEKCKVAKPFLGLYRSLIGNMVIGVSQGFEKRLQLIGVGYRAAVKGQAVDLQIGFSHPTEIKIPEGVNVKIDKSTLIIIDGADKRLVGQFAADVRAKRPPEPYKGKGIRYIDEYVRKKAGKSAKGA
ncbi:MAG: 50S ribosomal protein L6 [Chlamydiia bacterium]|nr:50S ribosomal protein L6 [Chlamydiia bacterium]MCP5509296.1 50S ribosomal protein L6 [Chlamydiales bacterium]